MDNSAFELLAKPIQHVLWEMKWRELRPIQVDAIRTLLTTDSDLLITARTASGKTEAAFLPILSRLFEAPGKSVGAMYVGPLKALINDQFQRLEQLCERAEIPVHRWHGDVDGGKKEKLLRDPRGVILITPESLESFFVNRPSRLEPLFADLRFVVIDEIHALVGRERGLQLRSQLFRLRRYTRQDFRLLGLSATVGDRIDYYRSWMRPDDLQRVSHIVDTDEKKRVQFGIQVYESVPPTVVAEKRPDDDIEGSRRLDELDSAAPDAMVVDALRNFGGTKNLIFCNSRGSVEWLADALNEACRRESRPEEFLVHHGSVSKELRYFAEEEMRGPRPSTAVCSATLELGIDIGNVRTVGQLGACWSVNSQVQRLGRSGRKDDEAHCMRVMIPLKIESADSDLIDRLYPELLQSIAIAELMLQRWVEPPDTDVRDRSTLIQQILSVLAECGGIAAKGLADRLRIKGAFRDVEIAEFAEVVRGLGKFGLIEQMQDGLLLLTPKGERLVHDKDFYSAFVTPQELIVRCDGRTIGSLSAMYLPQPEDHFLLAGRRWQVRDVDVEKGEVLVNPASGRKPPKYFGSTGEIHKRIREEMFNVVSGDKPFAYLNETAKTFLHSARDAYRRAATSDPTMVVLGPNDCLWFTWTGTRIQRTLVLLAEEAGLACSDEKLAVRIGCSPEAAAGVLSQFRTVETDSNRVEFDLEALPWRKFDEFLSPELLKEAFVHDRLDMEGARAAIDELVSHYPHAVSTQYRLEQVSTFITGSTDDETEDVRLVARSPLDLGEYSNLPLQECEFVAFDLETTGLHPVWSKIIEIGAIRFRLDGREIGRFHSLVDPGVPIPEDATRVHGITDTMVLGQPSIAAAIASFTTFLGAGRVVLIAHNADFDRRFLASSSAIHGLSLPSTPVLDTLSLAQNLLPGSPNYRLTTLAAGLGRNVGDAHRAIADAEAVRCLFVDLLTRNQIQSLEKLFDLGNVSKLNHIAAVECELPPGYAQLMAAIEERRAIQMLYATNPSNAKLHEVRPLSIITASQRAYLSAVCGFDGKIKLYRVDRIRKFIVT